MTSNPDQRKPDLVVVGAGVSGLTTAVCLAEQGLTTRVWSADPLDQTTSMAAGAMWGPYLVEPADKVERWSLASLGVFRKLARVDGTGVRLVTGIEASRAESNPPAWATNLDDYQVAEPDQLPPGFASGVKFTAPIIDMPVYLKYLEQRLLDAGGTIEICRIDSFDEAFAIAGVVINCAGVGARDLVPDPDLTAIRGQLVSIKNVGIEEFFSEETGDSPELLHIYPHGDSVILGGVAQPDNWNLKPDPQVARSIVERCSAIQPRIDGAKILGHRVGLRPTRATVRVEQQQTAHGPLIHNYGHGGAGVSLSWGCAHETLDLALRPR